MAPCDPSASSECLPHVQQQNYLKAASADLTEAGTRPIIHGVMYSDIHSLHGILLVRLTDILLCVRVMVLAPHVAGG